MAHTLTRTHEAPLTARAPTLVLVAGLLGIVTDYATNVDDAPWLLHGKPEPMTPR